MEQIPKQKTELKKGCTNCGAILLYDPGTTALNCDYCGHKETIITSKNTFSELQLDSYLNNMGAQSHSEQITMLDCNNCGAHQHVEEYYKSLHCIYCSTPLIVENTYQEDWITPGAVLPFQIDQKQAHNIFNKWVQSLWFAPNKLKQATLDPQKTKGLYAPYWTFDAQLKATYSGQRGTYYYVTRVVGSGKNRRTVRERKTRWRPVSGVVSGFVDDTLINASKQQSRIIPKKVSRWNLDLLKPFDSSYLRGFVTEKYTIPLKEGHLASKKEAKLIAEHWACRDIGGDRQRVSSMNMTLSDETFKHILLPVYINAYVYNDKRYNFYINGESGVISGQRPYSFYKIFFLVLTILFIAVLIHMFSK